MSLFHGLIETRHLRTGGGRVHTQRRFYCATHGWLDLVVFPNAEASHEKCGNITPAPVMDYAAQSNSLCR